MNLIEARKLGYDGWVRSPTCTLGQWCRATPWGFETENGSDGTPLCAKDLDAEDWEPRPAPAKPFEADVWVSPNGMTLEMDYVAKEQDALSPPTYADMGWRKIRVREVSSPEESSPSPPKVRVEIREATVGSSGSGFRCRKCGSICFTEQGATTCCWNHP